MCTSWQDLSDGDINFEHVTLTMTFDLLLINFIIGHNFLGHRSQRLQWPIVITRCPASVRRPLNYLHFRLLLQNCLMDFDETWYGWSTQGPLQVLLFFGQIRPGADPVRGKNRSQGVPFFKKLLLQTRRLQQQTECIAVIKKHVGRSVVIFGSIPKSNFWRVFDVFLDLVNLPYFMQFL